LGANLGVSTVSAVLENIWTLKNTKCSRITGLMAMVSSEPNFSFILHISLESIGNTYYFLTLSFKMC